MNLAKKGTLIGITGGIGSGKSTVSQILKDEGYVVLDCDKISREVTGKGSDTLSLLAEEFGKEILCKDGRLNRKKLARIAFQSKEKTKRLNEIVQTAILDRLLKRADKLRITKPVFFAEVPLLFEAGWDQYMDLNILVTASEEIRIERVLLRNPSMTKKDILLRMNKQMPEEEKAKKANWVLINEGSREELKDKITNCINEISTRL